MVRKQLRKKIEDDGIEWNRVPQARDIEIERPEPSRAFHLCFFGTHFSVSLTEQCAKRRRDFRSRALDKRGKGRNADEYERI